MVDRQPVDGVIWSSSDWSTRRIMRRDSTVQNAQYDATCVAIWTAKTTQGFQAPEIWLRLAHGRRPSWLRDQR